MPNVAYLNLLSIIETFMTDYRLCLVYFLMHSITYMVLYKTIKHHVWFILTDSTSCVVYWNGAFTRGVLKALRSSSPQASLLSDRKLIVTGSRLSIPLLKVEDLWQSHMPPAVHFHGGQRIRFFRVIGQPNLSSLQTVLIDFRFVLNTLVGYLFLFKIDL